ncbi:sugar transport protein [Prosthecobacter fusiformis]|uniref:Sugar transport protein n=2 Tax=Prosthecobacter fusiformis TaxID=48464 RepID=A0A4R7S3B3_9BACT|nr:sugar transport protein [Prosthecobacter fusiformis]
MALIAAFLGWMFDGFEMGLFPLIGKPALQDLLASTVAPEAMTAYLDRWFSVIIATFLVGAATGGVFFGWLGDRIGRVKAMSFSIFTYAIFTGLCGFATEAWHVAILRFIASLGMGGEWALGVALVNELWTKGNRALVAGAIGAAANIGYLLVAALSLGMNTFIDTMRRWTLALGGSEQLAGYLLDNQAWRFLMIIGALPAAIIFLIRIFVPESDKWEDEKAAGKTSYWSTPDLKGVLIGAIVALGIIWSWSPMGIDAGVTSVMAVVITVVGFCVVVWGYLLPVRRYLQRAQEASSITRESQLTIRKNLLIGATLAGIALLGTWGAAQQSAKWSTSAELDANGWTNVAQYTQIATSVGACIFAMFAPFLANMLNRRVTYLVMCISALGAALLFYQTNTVINTWFFTTAFLMGGVTASFYGFFPLYLPELFPTSVRATGQGFCFNVGRIIAAIGGLQIANLVHAFGTSSNAYSALCMVYIIGMVLVWIAPETKGKALA